jgi:hypothetical protein
LTPAHAAVVRDRHRSVRRPPRAPPSPAEYVPHCRTRSKTSLRLWGLPVTGASSHARALPALTGRPTRIPAPHCIPTSAPCARPWSLSPTPGRRRPFTGSVAYAVRRRAYAHHSLCARHSPSLVSSCLRTRPGHRARPSLDARTSAQAHLHRVPPVPLVRRSSRGYRLPSPIARAAVSVASISVTPGPQVDGTLATAQECAPPCALDPRCRPHAQLRYTTNLPLLEKHHPPLARTTRIVLETFVPTQYLPSPLSPSPRLVSFCSKEIRILV